MRSASKTSAAVALPLAEEPSDEVVTSNKDANWLESHNAVDRSTAADPTIAATDVRHDISGDPNRETDVTVPEAGLNKGKGNAVAPEALNHDDTSVAPPLPAEDVPPLPSEPLPEQDDGWSAEWDASASAFYFYNRFTGATQWSNPRVPDPIVQPGPPGVAPVAVPELQAPKSRPAGGYDPAIHGDYDPNAWYAQPEEAEPVHGPTGAATDSTAMYTATGAFNRFTGRWQAAELAPENFNDENKSKRQMNAFFDVDAAANSHDGKSLKAERAGKKLSKAELKEFKEKRKAKKEEKRRAWLRD